ncbi:MAG: transcriptional repressor [Anaerolineales bacterium]|nr:transcriptional repressor [Anaerolineales bacterium]
MTCGNQYTPQLRARGFRMTPQRLAILHTLHHADKHLSPTEVYERTSLDVPGLTEPTVYRTLEFLAENGLACSAHMGSGHLVYEIAKQGHHHLICRKCGAELKIEHALLEKLYAEMESNSGFRFIDSHVTFFGLCPECQKSNLGG